MIENREMIKNRKDKRDLFSFICVWLGDRKVKGWKM